MIVVGIKVSRGIKPFSPLEIDSADTSQLLLPNNPARQHYRYTSVPIEAEKKLIQKHYFLT